MDQVNLPGHNKQMRAAPAAPRRYDGQAGNPLYDPAQGGHYGTSPHVLSLSRRESTDWYLC